MGNPLQCCAGSRISRASAMAVPGLPTTMPAATLATSHRRSEVFSDRKHSAHQHHHGVTRAGNIKDTLHLSGLVDRLISTSKARSSNG